MSQGVNRIEAGLRPFDPSPSSLAVNRHGTAFWEKWARSARVVPIVLRSLTNRIGFGGREISTAFWFATGASDRVRVVVHYGIWRTLSQTGRTEGGRTN